MEILFFYKDEKEHNIPVRSIRTSSFEILFNGDPTLYEFKQMQKAHPQIEDNLFAFVEGETFKVPFV